MISPEKQQKRAEVLDCFRRIAEQDNARTQKVEFETLLGKDDKGKRILITMPGEIGDVFMITSLFESAKKQYPWANLYVATNPQFFPILAGNEHIYKVLPFVPQMENESWLEGAGPHKGFFEIAFLCHLPTQKIINYHGNGKHNLAFDVNL